MNILTLKQDIIKLISDMRFKESSPIKHKIFFTLENILQGEGNRNFVFRAIAEKINGIAIKIIDFSWFSPYHVSGIIPSVEQWFLGDLHPEIKGSWIKEVLPTKSVVLKKPKSIDDEIHSAFKNYQQIYSFPKTYLCSLKNGKIVNKNGVVVSYDDKVFADFTYEFDIPLEKNKIFKSYIQKPQFKNGVFATIVSPGSDTYFHWICDSLPRIKMIEGIRDEIDYLIVPEKLKQFHIETLYLLGFSEEKLVKISDSNNLLCENLIVPSMPGISGNTPKWACDFLREIFLPEGYSKPHRLIYISRKDAIYRKVINEREIEEFLQEFGFEIVEMSKLSFLEQVKICSEAKVVVGPHGAGLTNTLFCQKAKILEMFAPSYVNACYWMLSNQVGNEYYYILGNEHKGHPSPGWRDFYVDIKKLKKILLVVMQDL